MAPTSVVSGTVVKITVELSHEASSNTTAYDIEVFENMGTELQFAPSIGITQNTSGPVISFASTSAQNGKFTVSALPLNFNSSNPFIFSFDTVVTNVIVPGEQVDNKVDIQWTSLEGTDPDERGGTQTPGQDDYFASSNVASIVNDLSLIHI